MLLDGNGFMLGRKQFNDQRAKKRFSRKYNDIEVETGEKIPPSADQRDDIYRHFGNLSAEK